MTFQVIVDDLTEKALASLNDRPKYREGKLANEQLVLALLNTTVVVDTLQDWIDGKVQAERRISSKDYEKGEHFRREGNQFYVSGNNSRALELYNESIRYYPWPREGNMASGSEGHCGLPLAYGNRSAVLYNEKRFTKCLEDIDMAFQQGYPDNLKHKLLKRKAESLMVLGDVPEAKAALLQAKNAICRNMTKIENAEKYLCVINNLMEKVLKSCVTDKKQESRQVIDCLFKVKYGPNDILENASDGVGIAYSPSVGRYLISRKKFTPGDVVIIEKPSASIIFQHFYKSHCWHCCKYTDNIHPCFNCSAVTYCSEQCQKDSWRESHFLECHNVVKLQHLGIASIALQILLKNNIKTLIEVHFAFLRTVSKDVHPYGCQNEKYSADYKAVYHLVTNIKKMPFCDLVQYGIMAIALLLILRKSKFFERQEICNSRDKVDTEYRAACKDIISSFCSDRSYEPDFMELFYGSLLCKHIYQVVSNGLAVTGISETLGPQLSAVSQYGQLRYGTGMYPTASLMNHSCDPNCIQSFVNNTLIMKVAREIEPDQELTISYGPIFSIHTKDERQESLKRQYFFICQCSKCQIGPNSGPIFTSFKCQNCSSPITDLGSAACMACSVPFDKNWFLDLQSTSNALYNQCDEQSNQTIKILETCLKKQELIYYKYNRSLAETHNALAYNLANKKRFSEAVTHFEKSLEILKAIHGNDSVEIGHNLVTYFELLMEVLELRMPKSCVSEDKSIFALATKCFNVVQEASRILLNTTSMTLQSGLLCDLKEKEEHLKKFLKSSERL